MKKRLVIIGNSGAARECYWLAKDCIDAGADMEFKGFLSLEGYQGQLHELSEYFLGVDDAYTPAQDDVFVIGVGVHALRRKAFLKWKSRRVKFVNLVHPRTQLIGKISLGQANILSCDSYISCNTTVGDANYLNGSVVIGHDTTIGNYNFFAPFSIVLGGAVVGSENTFCVHSVLFAHAKIGNSNKIAPGSYVYKGCGNAKVMMGNPALVMGDAEELQG